MNQLQDHAQSQRQSQRMTQYYDQALKQGALDNLPQRAILPYFDELLCQAGQPGSQGLYWYGPVGIGKTWLMDACYALLEGVPKQRFHVQTLMQALDQALRDLQGVVDPLKTLAKQWVNTCRVLFLDDWVITDVVQLVFWVTWLPLLFEEGMILIATSNHAPNALYQDPLQQDRFQALIQCLQQHCKVHETPLGVGTDLRRTHSALRESSHVFNSMQALDACFTKLTDQQTLSFEPLWVQNRMLPCEVSSHQVVRFTFKQLCHIPRSALDYVALAKRFNVFFIENVPVWAPDEQSSALWLWIQLVDILYDHRVKLYVTVDGKTWDFPQSGPMAVPYRRTFSRLCSMLGVL